MPTLDPRIEGFLDANSKWATSPTHKPPIQFLEMQKKGRESEDGSVIVVACTDPRLSPEIFLGIGDGGSATIVRVAGGRVTTALNTLYVLSAVGTEGKKGVIVIVHHTDCGLCYITDEGIRESLRRRAVGDEELGMIDGMGFGSIEDPEVTVKEDMEILKNSSFFKGIQVVGLVQDTSTGLLKKVVDL